MSMGIGAQSADGGSNPSFGFGKTSEVGQEKHLPAMPPLRSEKATRKRRSENQYPAFREWGKRTISSAQITCITVEDDSDDEPDVIIERHIPPRRELGESLSIRVPVIVNPRKNFKRARYPLSAPTFVFPPVKPRPSDDQL